MTALAANPKQWQVGLIGYGEVGRNLAEDLRKQEVKVAAYDIKLRSDQAGGASPVWAWRIWSAKLAK